MRELLLSYGGKEYRCKVTFDVLMAIENKVAIHNLGLRIGAGEAPVSHIIWVYFNLLLSAGAELTIDDAHESAKTNQKDFEKVVSFLLEEVFDVGPINPIETDEEDEDSKKLEEKATG